MEDEATRENITSEERNIALTKVMNAKDNEVTALHNRVTVLQDRLK
jgi:hypothetical protein